MLLSLKAICYCISGLFILGVVLLAYSCSKISSLYKDEEIENQEQIEAINQYLKKKKNKMKGLR